MMNAPDHIHEYDLQRYKPLSSQLMSFVPIETEVRNF